MTGLLARSLARARARSLGPPGGVVLVYHRVATVAADPQRLAVTPARFAEHLAIITRYGVPLTFDAVVAGARAGALPAGAVAVTFDDGYADNRWEALPRLVDAGVPATFFVCTGATAAGGFWWDRLERLVLGPGARTHAEWTVEDGTCPTARHGEYLELCQSLRRMSGADRERALEGLAQAVNARPPESHRPLRADEIVAIAGTDHMSIGSHTVSHPSLAALAPDEQRREIVAARETLEVVTGRSVPGFAYPFGGAPDVPPCTVAMARAAGTTVACTTEPGRVHAGTDPHRVPRFVVRNWTATEFERRFVAWVGAR